MKKTETTKYYVAASVACAVFAVYLSSLHHQFILWDDDLYVYENLHIRSLDMSFFKWAFFDFHAGNWHPLTWMSHALDYAVWGLNPMGHHLTNIVLHAINTFLVVVLIARLLEAGDLSLIPLKVTPPPPAPPLKIRANSRPDGAEGRGSYDPMGAAGGFSGNSVLIAAATTGLLFGLHPLHVESVAWVSERKDLLCAFFFLLSIMSYMTYATYRTYKNYILSLVFFTFALMSKPMAVSLPIVLLILDWYPFERVRSLQTFRTAVFEKFPFMALGLASAVVTVLAQRAGSAFASATAAPFSTRLLVGVKSLMAYLWKMVLPVDLVPFYPYPKEVSPASLEYLSAIALVVGITIACIVIAKRQKLFLSAWGYYVIVLIPVLGIVQVGQQSMADRYTYLPSLGPFLLIGVMGAWVWARATGSERGGPFAKLLAVAVSAGLIVSLSYLTIRQTGIWKDSIVFWSYVIEKEPEKVPVAYYNRGIAFDKMGMSDEAIADYDRAIALKPDYYDAYNNRGLIFETKGLFDKAIKDLETAMAMRQSSPEAYNNLGKIYRRRGQSDKAIENYNRAIALNPSYEESYYNRAISYEKMGRFDAAIEDYNRAIALRPTYYEAYNNLGVLYGNSGSLDKAIENFSKAVSLNPGLGGAYVNRGVLYARTGKKELAVSDFQKACDLGNKAGCSAVDALVKGQVK